MSRRAVLAALPLALAAACSRPPRGMTRLDAGSNNHFFRVDARLRRLFYIEGGDGFITRLGVVDLDTRGRAAYRFAHQRIVGLRPAAALDAVKVATEGTGETNEDEDRLLLVDAVSGRILRQEAREDLEPDDLASFAPDADRPAPNPGAASYSVRRSSAAWSIVERRAGASPRVVASFPAEVESMAPVGAGLAVLRRASPGSSRRELAMVNAVTAHVDLELPWNDGDSEILAADTAKHLLYLRMFEGENESAWAVHFDEAALRAASVWLARHRGPDVRKLTDTDEVGLVIAAGAVILVIGLFAVRGTAA